MRDFFWLLGLNLTQANNNFHEVNREKVTKGFVFFFAGAFFFPMVFQLFYFIFKHFYSAAIIGGLLVNKILYTFYLTFAVMIILSAVVSSISVLFLSKETDFIFSLPVKIESIFTLQYVKIITEACWMVFLMAIPIFAAYMYVIKIGLFDFFFILLSHVPFFIVAASIGIIITLFLVRFFPAESVRNVAIAVFGIFIVIVVIYFRMLEPEKLTGANEEEVMSFIKNLQTPESIFLPHAALMRIIADVTAAGIFQGLQALLYYFSVSLLVFAVTVYTARKWYFEGYAKKGVYKKEKPLPQSYEYKEKPFFLSMLYKDSQYLLRDTSQWIQIVFLFGLVIIYLFNIYKLPADLFDIKNLIYFLNIGFIGFVLAAVGSRLILPVVSNEGKGFWIFKTAPVSMAKYVFQKFITYCIPMVLTGQAVAVLSIIFLKTDRFVSVLTVISALLITLVISGVGVGLGAYFVNFRIKNPEELITGVAGITYMFVTILFVSGLMVIEAGPVRDFYMAKFLKFKNFDPGAYWNEVLLAAAVAAAVIALSLWAGIQKLKRMEL
jgi:ABC-2 type transport system permease protein